MGNKLFCSIISSARAANFSNLGKNSSSKKEYNVLLYTFKYLPIFSIFVILVFKFEIYLYYT